MAKSERVTARVSPDVRRVVELAADARGETMSSWVARAVKLQSYSELLNEGEDDGKE